MQKQIGIDIGERSADGYLGIDAERIGQSVQRPQLIRGIVDNVHVLIGHKVDLPEFTLVAGTGFQKAFRYQIA